MAPQFDLFIPLASAADDLFVALKTAFDHYQFTKDAATRDVDLAAAAGKVEGKRQGSTASQRDKYLILQKFYEAYLVADSPMKRGILYQGVVGFLGPSLEEGWSGILWDRLVALEPAELLFLDELDRSGGPMALAPGDSNVELADRLAQSGLVTIRPQGEGIEVSLRGAASKLLSFVNLGGGGV